MCKGNEKVAPQSKRRERDSDTDDGSSVSKKEATEKSRPFPVYQKPRPVVTRDSFAPLTAVPMDGAEASNEGTSPTNETLDKGKPPSVLLTSEANLLSLQKELKNVVTGEYFFRNTASVTWITTKCCGL
jgi:hypothetical protein